MTERELLDAIARRSGANPDEVRAVVRELFPQAFAMAVEKGGSLVVPYFGTFECRPHADHGAMQHRFRPRRPGEIIKGVEERRRKIAGRRQGSPGAKRFAGMPRLDGEPYVPRPAKPCAPGDGLWEELD